MFYLETSLVNTKLLIQEGLELHFLFAPSQTYWEQILGNLPQENVPLFDQSQNVIYAQEMFQTKVQTNFKGCVCYIFANLFFMSKREHLWNKEECFLFHLESSFCSWDNQILTFQIFKCHDVIKCPSMKHEIHFTE